MPEPVTPFHDLGDYVAIPRLIGLVLSPDGGRLVASVQQPSPAPPPALPGTLVEVEAAAPDGATVRGWLVLPAGAAHPAPLQQWIHGGPYASYNTWSWTRCPWLSAARGWAVLMPDPALSTGYGRA